MCDDQEVMTTNLHLKKKFKNQGLDLKKVWHPIPHDIPLENRQLQSLYNFITCYQKLGYSRQAMEAQGYLFPPIQLELGPEEDWRHFHLWMMRAAHGEW